MPSIVCQNLISCFESQLTETTTTLKLKVIKPGIEDYQPPVHDQKPRHEFNNWGFLQITPKEATERDSDCYYAQKNASSYSRLSAKSLELCTENLGSETGTDTITDSSIFSSTPCNPTSEGHENYAPVKRTEPENPRKSTKRPHHQKTKNDFPPPLTTMSGSSSLQVRRHTEGGRLIIEAVEAPFRNSYLQAERCNGRLRLCFLNTSETTTATTTASPEGQDEQEEDEGIEEASSESESKQEQEQEQEQFDGGENNRINHVEMGNIEKFQWMSRCKEGRHWKPAALWVATS